MTYELLGNVPTANITSAVLGESSIVTTINKVVEQSSTTLRYKIGDTVIRQTYIGASVSDTYIVPPSAGQYFPAQKTATMTIEAETFVNGESYGVVTTTVTLTLPDGANPTATCTPTRTWIAGVSAASQINAYVQAKSGVSFALEGAANYGATVSTFTVSIEGKSYTRTGNGSIAHSPLSGSGTISYTYSVTDSRG